MPGKYNIAIPFSGRGIKDFQITLKNNEVVIDQVSIDFSHTTFIFQFLNLTIAIQNDELSIIWDSTKIVTLSLLINFNQCNEDQYAQNGWCVDKCELFEIGKQCVSECKEGYFQESESTCKQCPIGCQSCNNNEQICTNCFPQYYLISNQCFSTCIQGFFEHNGKCQECLPESENCVINDNCFDCIQSGILYKCVKQLSLTGTEGIYNDKCINCHQSCNGCIGNTAKDCLVCNRNYQRYFGECI